MVFSSLEVVTRQYHGFRTACPFGKYRNWKITKKLTQTVHPRWLRSEGTNLRTTPLNRMLGEFGMAMSEERVKSTTYDDTGAGGEVFKASLFRDMMSFSGV